MLQDSFKRPRCLMPDSAKWGGTICRREGNRVTSLGGDRRVMTIAAVQGAWTDPARRPQHVEAHPGKRRRDD